MNQANPRNVTVVQKNNSGCKILMIILAIMAVIAALLVGGCFMLGAYTVGKINDKVEADRQEQAEVARNMSLSGYKWRLAQYGGGIEADFRVTNNNDYDVTGSVFEFIFLDESDKEVGSQRETSHKAIKAGESIEIQGFKVRLAPIEAKEVKVKLVGGLKPKDK